MTGLSLGNKSRSFPKGLMLLSSVLWDISCGICVSGAHIRRLLPGLTNGLPALATPAILLRPSIEKEAGEGPGELGRSLFREDQSWEEGPEAPMGNVLLLR